MTTDSMMPLVGPTVSRIAQAKGIEIEMPVVNRRVVRKAWRMVSVIETMRREGKLCDGRWEAWERFERDWRRTELGASIISKYGEQAGSGGTPLTQLREMAFERAAALDEVRFQATRRVMQALSAVGVPRMQWALLMVAGQECNLEMIGQRISRYADRGKAIAVAASAIEDGLWLLHNHYQNLYAQSQTAP